MQFDISILAPWQSSKLTASEFPNRTGGGGNPEVAEMINETHFCSQDKSEIIIGYQDTPNYLDPVSKMTLKVWPGVPSSIGPQYWAWCWAMMDIYNVSPGVIIIFITIAPFWGTMVGFDKIIFCSHIHIVIQRLLGESFPRSPPLRQNFLRPGERFL